MAPKASEGYVGADFRLTDVQCSGSERYRPSGVGGKDRVDDRPVGQADRSRVEILRSFDGRAAQLLREENSLPSLPRHRHGLLPGVDSDVLHLEFIDFLGQRRRGQRFGKREFELVSSDPYPPA